MPFIKSLRRVFDSLDVFEDYDHNDHVNNWIGQVEVCKGWASLLREQYPEIEDYVAQLENIVKQMRYVQKGDYYTAKDHNLFVRAWKKLLEIDRIIASHQPGLSELVTELEGIVYRMKEIASGEYYRAEYHNLFADAWDVQLKISVCEVIILPRGDWQGMLEYVTDTAVVFVDVNIETATPDDVLSLLSTYAVKLLVMIDTQPYHKGYCGAFRDILYTVDYFTGYGSGRVDLNFDHDKQYFEADSVPSLYDYFPKNADRAPDVTPWTMPYPDYWGYKYVKNGVVVEVPYDGSWLSTRWLDKFIFWKPCSYPEIWAPVRIIVISNTTTDAAFAHEYPTLDETLKALAEQYNWIFKDLR